MDSDSSGNEDVELAQFGDETSQDNMEDVEPEEEKTVQSNIIFHIRDRLWIFLDVPTSSRISFLFGLFIMALVALSILILLLETLPQYYKDPPAAFFIMECIIVGIFTVEFFLRFITCPSQRRFWKSFGTYVDILSFLPFYIELFVSRDNDWIRVLRIIRLFRVFKFTKYYETESFGLLFEFVVLIFPLLLLMLTYALISIVKNSFSTIFLTTLFLIMIGMVVFSSFIFYAEQTYSYFSDKEEKWYYNDDTILPNAESFFQSIPHSMWWCIVTMTTTGYGDTYPLSAWGKLVAGLTFLAGLAIISFPVGIIGNRFITLYAEQEELTRKKKDAKNAKTFISTNNKESLDTAYPFYPPPIRKLKDLKKRVDDELSELENRIMKLKVQAIEIDRALELFDWSATTSLLDIEYVSKVTDEMKAANAPFTALELSRVLV